MSSPSHKTSIPLNAAAVVMAAALGLAAAPSMAGAYHDAHVWFGAVDHGGAVYAMTNSSKGNEIRVYHRASNGRLRALPFATVATGGLGGGDNAAVDPLGSQNALVFDAAQKMLFAVNAGDNTVAAFRPTLGLRLQRTALVASGGYIPVSVAVRGDRLYVLNAGGSGSVATFDIGAHGQLTLLGTLDLGQSHSTTIPFDNVMAPGQVGVDALDRQLIVTNGGTQQLFTAELDDDGVPTAPLTATASPGVVPFAFDITPYGDVLVAEAGSGSVTSYQPPALNQPLTVTTATVATDQAATCWIVAGDNGFAYTANTGSDTISQFSYARNGTLTLTQQVAATADSKPTDMTLAGHGKFLYTLDAGSGSISGFAIDATTGALSAVSTQGGLPAAGIQGIAAFDY